MAFLRQKNPQGYVFGELYSALQKSMRRGLEEDSVYWARQIGNTNPNALHKRLLLCALEDMPYPSLVRHIMTIPPSAPGLSEMLRTVITLCRVPKTHITAWANRVAGEIIIQQHQQKPYPPFDQRPELVLIAQYLIENKEGRLRLVRALDAGEHVKTYKTANEDPLLYIMHILLKHRVYSPPPPYFYRSIIDPADNTHKEFPSWVFDKHTARGKAAGHGYAHFFANGVVFNESLLTADQDSYEEEARRLYLDYEKRLGSKARTRTGQLISKFRRPEPGKGNAQENDVEEEDEEAGEAKETKVPQKKRPSTPTKRPASPQPVSVIKRRPSTNAAAGAAGEPDTNVMAVLMFESQYSDLLQTQLLTASYKPRVFFAHDAAGNPVVIKGPVTLEFARQQLLSESLKQLFQLPHGSMQLEKIGHQLFLVSQSFIAYDPNAFVLKTSSLETDAKISTNVVEPWDHNYILLPTHAMNVKILLALAFRKAIGTNDTTPRNFIVHRNRATGETDVATIDDPALMQDTRFMWKTQIKPDAYKSALQSHWPAVRQELQKWITLLKASDEDTMPVLFKSFVLRRLAVLNNEQNNWTF